MKDKTEVVVITGATAGVGRATVREFAGNGACIGLLARDPDRLDVTRKEVEALGGKAISVVTDVAYPDQVEAAASRIEEAFGPIDIWINNAMVTVFSPIKELEPEEIRRVTEVTYLGAVHGTLSALRRMLPRNQETIVQVGSALAYRASRCNLPIAPPSTPSWALPSRSVPSCFTTRAKFTSRWCSCRH
jgi:NADP-dependent 3-hydroxy acid dehydrogenase YdfG